MGIVETYNRLTDKEKGLLQIGFESGSTQIVIFKDGSFISVNFDHRDGYIATESKNRWTVGVTNEKESVL